MSGIPIELVDKYIDNLGTHVKRLNTKLHRAEEKLKLCGESADKSAKIRAELEKKAKKCEELEKKAKKCEELEKTIKILEKNNKIDEGLVSEEFMADRYGAILDEHIREIDSYDYDAFQRAFEKRLNI
jgi:predicted RNase H-like nuclease (RuvC/YqgF family)